MKRLLALFLFSLLGAAHLPAQQSATVSGALSDPSGAAVVGAAITLDPAGAHRSSAAIARTKSDAVGRFSFSVPAGSYRLRIVHPYFARYEQELNVQAGEHREVAARLALNGMSERIIVSATAEPAAADTIAAPVNVITAQEISQRQVTFLADAISLTPGVSIGRSGRIGGVTSLFLDGGNSNYTKVLVDGAPLNEPGGAVDFSNISLDNVAKIEVVHGAESALYGSDAMAGVVQIFTARGSTHTPQLDLVAEGGNFSSARGAATLSGLLGNFDYSAGFARFDTQGQGVNNNYRDETLSGNFGWRFTDTNTARLAVRNSTSDAGIAGQTLITPPDLNQHNALHSFTAGLAGDFSTGAHWQHHVAMTETYLSQLFDNPLSDYFLSPDPFGSCTGMPRSPQAVSANFCDFTFLARNQFNRVDLTAQSSYLVRKGSFTAGYDYDIENGWLSDIGKAPAEGHARRNNQAGFIEARYQFGERLTATAGARAEDNASFGTRVVPRAGLAFLARKGDPVFGPTRLRFSYGLGIKEPKLDQSFGTDPCFPGNPNLRPERSSTLHTGVDQVFWGERFRATVDYYYNRFHDLISFGTTTLAGCGFAGTYFNTDLARAQGVNLNFELKPATWLRIAAGYAYDDSRVLKAQGAFVDPAETTGNRLLRRPLHSGSLVVNTGRRMWNANLTGYFSGRRTDSDFQFLGFTRTPGYARFDVAGSYELRHGVQLFARVENLFDRQYQEILGFPALGRAFRAGMKFRIGGE